MKWEYQVFEKVDWEGPDYAEDWLDDMGFEGWELIHVSESLKVYIFKRPTDWDQQ